MGDQRSEVDYERAQFLESLVEDGEDRFRGLKVRRVVGVRANGGVSTAVEGR
jgi:hypothetical protein